MGGGGRRRRRGTRAGEVEEICQQSKGCCSGRDDWSNS